MATLVDLLTAAAKKKAEEAKQAMLAEQKRKLDLVSARAAVGAKAPPRPVATAGAKNIPTPVAPKPTDIGGPRKEYSKYEQSVVVPKFTNTALRQMTEEDLKQPLLPELPAYKKGTVSGLLDTLHSAALDQQIAAQRKDVFDRPEESVYPALMRDFLKTPTPTNALGTLLKAAPTTLNKFVAGGGVTGAVEAAKGIFGPFVKATEDLGREAALPDIPEGLGEDKDAIARRASAAGRAIYEGAKLYALSGAAGTGYKTVKIGNELKQVPVEGIAGLLGRYGKPLAMPNVYGSLSQIAPEEARPLIRPLLEAYSIGRAGSGAVPKLAAAFNVMLGYADDPLWYAIQDNKQFSQPTKELLILGLNLLENGLAIWGANKVNSIALHGPPTLKAAWDSYKKDKSIASALEAAAEKRFTMAETEKFQVEAQGKTLEDDVLGESSKAPKPLTEADMKKGTLTKGKWEKQLGHALVTGDTDAINRLTLGLGAQVDGRPVKFEDISMKLAGENKLQKLGPRSVVAMDDDFNRAMNNPEYVRALEGSELERERPILRSDMPEAKKIVEGIDYAKVKDISSGDVNKMDIYDNTKRVLGKNADGLLKAWDESKGLGLQSFLSKWNDLAYKKIVKELGISKGSKISGDVQRFGEGLLSLDDIKTKYPNQWQNIVEADKFYRSAYDQILPEINKAIAQTYPNQPDKLLNKHSKYYRHFTESEKFLPLRLLQIGTTREGTIDPRLEGISDYTKPDSKFSSIKQERTGNETTYDAVGGFLNYLPQAGQVMYVDPFIPKFRALARQLAGDTVDTGKINNYIRFLEQWTNGVAGKTSPLDRSVQDFMGRKAFAATSAVASNIKANMVLGNLSSVLAQPAHLAYGTADAGVMNMVKGVARYMTGFLSDYDQPIKESPFITERYAHSETQFENKLSAQPKKAALALMRLGDEVAVKAVWNAEYEKALSQGVDDPIRYADMQTRRVAGGRGIGELTLAQQSKVYSTALPFTVEVQRLYNNLKGDVKTGQFGKLVKFAIASTIFNQLVHSVRGSDVLPDVIGAGQEAYNAYQEELAKGDENKGLVRAGGRMIGELLQYAPAANIIAGFYPEYGTEWGLPARSQLFGEGDPTRFGTGNIFESATKDPALSLITPWGGAQLNKTARGIEAWNKGYTETRKGQVEAPVEQTIENFLRMAAFGKGGARSQQQYYDEDRRPLSERDSVEARFATPEQRQRIYEEAQVERLDSAEEARIRDRGMKIFQNNIEAEDLNETLRAVRKEYAVASKDVSPEQLYAAQQMKKYEGVPVDQLTLVLEAQNRADAYKRFNDGVISDLLLMGFDPSKRKLVSHQIKNLLENEAQLYPESQVADIRVNPEVYPATYWNRWNRVWEKYYRTYGLEPKMTEVTH